MGHGERSRSKGGAILASAAVAALIAIPVAVAGSGGDERVPAASTQQQVKKLAAKVKRLTKRVAKIDKEEGPQGPQGLQGPQGPPGVAGLPGVDGGSGQVGSAGAGLLFASGNVSDSSTAFTNLAGDNFGTESPAQSPMPAGASLTARDWVARLRNPVAVGTVTLEFRVNGSPALTCGPIGVGQQSCQSAQTVQLNPGDLVNFRSVASGAAGVFSATHVMRIVF